MSLRVSIGLVVRQRLLHMMEGPCYCRFGVESFRL